ncbi:MAG: hypothetical protein ACJ8C4_01670 [Gemmataceae bacterium]
MRATISRDELKTKIDRGGPVHAPRHSGKPVLSPLSFARINMPYDQVNQLAPTLLPDKNAKILTYCYNPS